MKPLTPKTILLIHGLLALLAVAVVVGFSDFNVYKIIRTFGPGCMHSPTITESMEEKALARRLTPDQRLILFGDSTRSNEVDRQKAIWDRWPANRIYLHHYVTSLAEKKESLPELERLQALDPDNARFDYLRASLLLDEAVETDYRQVDGSNGESRTVYDFTLEDPAKLDQAMALLKAGLAKPVYRRYAREMAAEKLAIMGPPETMAQEIVQFVTLAGLLLPDLATMKRLGRTSAFYGDLLARKGRREEADVFLQAYGRLTAQFTRDSFTLIDVLVADSMAKYAEEQVPGIYERLGDTAAAERVRLEAGRLAAPLRQWRDKRKAAETDPAMKAEEERVRKQGGIVSWLLIASLMEYPTREELTPSRLLEYTVAEEMALILFSWLLLGAMLVEGVIVFIHGRLRGSGPASLVLLPDPREWALIGLGLLLPLLAYYGGTRWLPVREEGLVAGALFFTGSVMVLLLAIGGLIGFLNSRLMKRHCAKQGVPVKSWAYHASLCRLDVPVLAVALIVVNLCAWPVLRGEERHWLKADTIMRPDPNGCITTLEARLIHRLKTEMEQAAEGF